MAFLYSLEILYVCEREKERKRERGRERERKIERLGLKMK